MLMRRYTTCMSMEQAVTAPHTSQSERRSVVPEEVDYELAVGDRWCRIAPFPVPEGKCVAVDLFGGLSLCEGPQFAAARL
jgi:hypothetical protein